MTSTSTTAAPKVPPGKAPTKAPAKPPPKPSKDGSTDGSPGTKTLSPVSSGPGAEPKAPTTPMSPAVALSPHTRPTATTSSAADAPSAASQRSSISTQRASIAPIVLPSPVTRQFAACKPPSGEALSTARPVIVIGRTGSGKSTFISIAMGAEAALGADNHIVLSQPSGGPAGNKKNAGLQFPTASHKLDSETTVPSVWRGADGTKFLDTAGLGDNREDGSAVWADGALDLALRHVRSSKVVVCFPSNVFERPRAADFDPYVLEPVRAVATALRISPDDAVDQVGFVANGPSFQVPPEFLRSAHQGVMDEVAKLRVRYPTPKAQQFVQKAMNATTTTSATSKLLESVEGVWGVEWKKVTAPEQQQLEKKLIRCVLAQRLAQDRAVFICAVIAAPTPGILFDAAKQYLDTVQPITKPQRVVNASGNGKASSMASVNTGGTQHSLGLAKELSDFAASVAPLLFAAADALSRVKESFDAEQERLKFCRKDYLKAKGAEEASAAKIRTAFDRRRRDVERKAADLRSDTSPVFFQATTLEDSVNWFMSFFTSASDECTITCPGTIVDLKWNVMKGDPSTKVVDGIVGQSSSVKLKASKCRAFTVEARAFIAANADPKTVQVVAEYDRQASSMAAEWKALEAAGRELSMVTTADELVAFVLRESKAQRALLKAVLPPLLESNGSVPSTVVAAQGALEWIQELTAAKIFAMDGMALHRARCDELAEAVAMLQPLLDTVSDSDGAVVLGDTIHRQLRDSTAQAIARQRRAHTDRTVGTALPVAISRVLPPDVRASVVETARNVHVAAQQQPVFGFALLIIAWMLFLFSLYHGDRFVLLISLAPVVWGVPLVARWAELVLEFSVKRTTQAATEELKETLAVHSQLAAAKVDEVTDKFAERVSVRVQHNSQRDLRTLLPWW